MPLKYTNYEVCPMGVPTEDDENVSFEIGKFPAADRARIIAGYREAIEQWLAVSRQTMSDDEIISEARSDQFRRNQGDVAQGYYFGVERPALLRRIEELQS
jgi:hypothetical protein